MAIDASRIAAALHALADAVLGKDPEPATEQATPARRGRGRPVVGEAPVSTAASNVAAPVVATATVAESDPFATTTPATGPVVPSATIDQVRDALKALKEVTSQENALKVLKDVGGASNLTELKADKYGWVAEAARAATVAAGKAAAGTPNAADDPFATPAETTTVEEVPSLEDIKKLIVETQKRASAGVVQKLVMDMGGKAKNPDTGAEGPALSPLPVSKYLELAKALKALPTTK